MEGCIPAAIPKHKAWSVGRGHLLPPSPFNPCPLALLGVCTNTSGITLCRCEDLWGQQWTVQDTDLSSTQTRGLLLLLAKQLRSQGIPDSRQPDRGLAELHNNPASGLA